MSMTRICIPRTGKVLAVTLVVLVAAACSAVPGTPEPAIPGAASTDSATPSSMPSATPTTAPAANEGNPPVDTATPSPDDGDPISTFYREFNPDGPKAIDASSFNQVLPRDAIAPIYEPSIATAEEAGPEMDDAELVVGVTLGAESRAYPVRTISTREMVNDELGGVPILVTW